MRSHASANAILGTLDVVDPETGRQYKVSNYFEVVWNPVSLCAIPLCKGKEREI